MKTLTPAVVAAILATTLSGPFALADASYQTTSQITGGSLVDTLKQASAFLGSKGKAMFAPTNTITMVHGNQRAVVSKDSTEIIDLDKGTITRIDNDKKTYTVVTFAQMRDAFTQMSKQLPAQQAKMQQEMKQAQAQQPPSNVKTTVDMKVNNTGFTKQVNGLTAQEQLITMTMKMVATDPASVPASAQAPGQPGEIDYVITTDAWIAPDPPQIKEIHDFDIRMGQKMMEGVDMSAFVDQLQAGRDASANMGAMMGMPPGSADAMKKMGEEMNKIKGTRVLQVISMGGAGSGAAVAASAQGTASALPPPPPVSLASVTADNVATAATNSAVDSATSQVSKLGGFAGAVGGAAFGGFRRKPAAAPAAPAPAAAGQAAGGAAGAQSGVLMVTTMQETNFSADPIPASVFQVPAGFKLVSSPYDKGK